MPDGALSTSKKTFQILSSRCMTTTFFLSKSHYQRKIVELIKRDYQRKIVEWDPRVICSLKLIDIPLDLLHVVINGYSSGLGHIMLFLPWLRIEQVICNVAEISIIWTLIFMQLLRDKWEPTQLGSRPRVIDLIGGPEFYPQLNCDSQLAFRTFLWIVAWTRQRWKTHSCQRGCSEHFYGL